MPEPLGDPWTLPSPNVRSMLVPDPGYVLVEADLARADAQVCAWDAGCEALKRIFQSGQDIHADNARRLYGAQVPVRSLHINGMTFRDNAKRAVHLADYAGGPGTLATACSLPRSRAEYFIRWWTQEEHPAIGEWQQRYSYELTRRKLPTVYNAFGFRKLYTDRPDRLLGQALAWVCQSTVGIVINHAMLRFDRELPEAQLLLQVHDSLLFQVPTPQWPDLLPRVQECMRVTVPYPDPLIIASEVKWSPTDWGHMEKIDG